MTLRYLLVTILAFCMVINVNSLAKLINSLVPIDEPLYSILKLTIGISGVWLFTMFARPKQKKSGS